MYQNRNELEIALLEAKKQFQGNFGNKEKKVAYTKHLKIYYTMSLVEAIR